jgi:hypothetical protein
VPETYHEIFRGLRDAQVAYLLTGATALTLHGVPRISYDVDLLVEPSAANLERALRLLAGWGYAERAGADGAAPGAPGGSAVRRFAHPASPIGEIDLVPSAASAWAGLAARAAAFTLVDVPIPAVSREDLLALKEASARPQDREDAASLRVLAAVERGEEGDPADARRDQIVKFRRWHAENRCEWLLAANQLHRGLPPDAQAGRDARFRRRSPWKR